MKARGAGFYIPAISFFFAFLFLFFLSYTTLP